MAKHKKIPKPNKKGKKPIKEKKFENKKLIIAVLVVALLILFFASYRAWLNFHFLVADDLVLNLEPQDKSLYIHYEEKPNVTFSVNIENSFFCNSYCTYEFKDLSAESIIGNGAFATKAIEKKFEKSFQLSVNRPGSGQKIYSFNVQCHNIRTWYCPTNENSRKRSSFVTLNYDISDYEKLLKSALKENITILAKELSNVDIKIQEVNNRFFELGFNVNLNELEGSKEILNNDYNAIALEFKNLERVWSEQNYLLLSELFNLSYSSRISAISQKITELDSAISNVVERHNSIAAELNNLDSIIRSMNETLLFLNRRDKGLIGTHTQLLDVVKQLKLLIQSNTFANYSFFDNEILELNKSIQDFEKEASQKFAYGYLSGVYYANLEKSILCSIKGICINKTGFLPALISSKDIRDDKIRDLCSSFSLISESHERENNKSKELMKNYPFNEVNNITEGAKSKKIYIAEKNISNEIRGIIADNGLNEPLNILISLIKTELNLSEEINYKNFKEDEILSLIQLNLSNNSAEYYSNYCNGQQFNLSKYYGDVTQSEQVQPNSFKKGNFTSRINIILAENYPICCVFGVCKRCCTEKECKEDASLYPILLLHGHAFNSGNSPEFSLDAFNKIQTKLQEDGYIGAGTITPVSGYSEIKEGEWGLSSRPISVKGSYYLLSYYNLSGYSLVTQKSENIETYAIRLKELIDLLKFRTGKDKVIIISHSMGGLVARSYMQIFGDSSVYSLIMLNVPNKGVSGQVSSYCPILGEKKECNDMSENSIFIKNLNDPLKIPKNAKLYNIIGIGCDMDGKTGDGVVTKENAELDYAKNYYINGTCSRLKPLHTNMLNIGNYPKVYETIKSILKT